MLLRFFNSANLSRLFAAFLIAILFWIPGFYFSSSLIITPWNAPLYDLYLLIPIKIVWINTTIAFLLNFVTALVVNSLASTFGLSDNSSYRPAFLYLLLSAMLPEFTRMNPFIMLNFLLALYFFNVLKISVSPNPIFISFNGGFILGLATLFYPPFIFLLLPHCIILIINRINHWRSYTASILGAILPFIYLFSYYFWVDQLVGQTENILKDLKPKFTLLYPHDTLSLILFVAVALLLLISSFNIYTNLNKRKINKRKNIGVILYLLFFMLFIYLFYAKNVSEVMALAVPSALIIGDYVRHIKKMKWIELFVMLLVVLIIINNFIRLYNVV